jgi:hypothetical protein
MSSADDALARLQATFGPGGPKHVPDESDRLLAAMATAEAKAWDALSRYKFYMFGYHAAQWVLLNQVSGLSRPNPFRELVSMARARIAIDKTKGESNGN